MTVDSKGRLYEPLRVQPQGAFSNSQGLTYDLNMWRVVVQRLGPRYALQLGAQSLQLKPLTVPRMVQDSSAWATITPKLSGICGSDLGLLRGSGSPYLAPLISWPVMLGHEIVGTVASSNTPWHRGQRVVVNPTLSCGARGLPPCMECQAGNPDGCWQRHHGGLGPGLLIGFNREIPGGWSAKMWVPVDQLIPVPADLDDRRAVLVEPASIVYQGLTRVDWNRVSTVLIIGAGTIGLLSTWLIATQHPDVLIVQRCRYPHQATVASSVGARRVQVGGSDGEFASSARLDEWVGPVLPKFFGGGPYRPGGFDLVVDSVGTQQSLGQGLSLVRPDGQFLLLGGAGRINLDLAPVWSRRLTVIGTYGYGSPEMPPNTTFQTVVSALHQTAYPIESVVTHTVLLSQFREAFHILGDRTTHAIKVAFQNDLAQ